MNFLTLTSQMDAGKSEHAKLLVSVRDGTQNLPTPEQWASSILAMNGYSALSVEANRVASALESAYLFDLSLWDLAKNNTYDFLKHASDWIDSQQLYYLADPSIHFLTTDESTIRKRVAASSQAARILTLRDEAKKLGCTIT